MFELRVTDMSLQLELNCLVLGADISSIFPVKIANTESVGTFKELIKDKKRPAFDHVPADTLKLFKVSFPVDDDLDATLKRFRPEHDPQNGVHHLSVPVKRLRGVFGDPIDEHLHVIVLPPPAGECQLLWPFVSITHYNLPIQLRLLNHVPLITSILTVLCLATVVVMSSR